MKIRTLLATLFWATSLPQTAHGAGEGGAVSAWTEGGVPDYAEATSRESWTVADFEDLYSEKIQPAEVDSLMVSYSSQGLLPTTEVIKKDGRTTLPLYIAIEAAAKTKNSAPFTAVFGLGHFSVLPPRQKLEAIYRAIVAKIPVLAGIGYLEDMLEDPAVSGVDILDRVLTTPEFRVKLHKSDRSVGTSGRQDSLLETVKRLQLANTNQTKTWDSLKQLSSFYPIQLLKALIREETSERFDRESFDTVYELLTLLPVEEETGDSKTAGIELFLETLLTDLDLTWHLEECGKYEDFIATCQSFKISDEVIARILTRWSTPSQAEDHHCPHFLFHKLQAKIGKLRRKTFNTIGTQTETESRKN